VRTAGALEGRVLEVVGRFLERVPPRQREDLLVGGDEVGHPGDGGDDERLSGGVDVGLRPWQHPHARQLSNRRSVKRLDATLTCSRTFYKREEELTVGIAEATVATAAALAPARVASASYKHAKRQ
jgi:hypothetical protein